MCNYRHPGPWRVWEVGPEPQFLTPFRSPRGRVDEFPKRPSCCYTRHFRAREVRGPFRAMRRLRSWSGSRRSRARESTAKSTFIRKTPLIWKTFFMFLPNGAKHLIFTMKYHLRDGRVFDIFVPNWPSPFLAQDHRPLSRTAHSNTFYSKGQHEVSFIFVIVYLYVCLHLHLNLYFFLDL